MKKYKNGKSEEIADDVASNFVITDDDKVLYLQDYSAKRDEGDLYVYKNGESEKIDTDVERIINLWEYYY